MQLKSVTERQLPVMKWLPDAAKHDPACKLIYEHTLPKKAPHEAGLQ